MIPLLVPAALEVLRQIGLTEWIGEKLGGQGGAQTAEAVVSIARAVTGASSPQDAIRALADDPEKVTQLKQQMIMAFAQQQNAVNMAEAQNTNLFVSGGRPFIIWICGFGLGFQCILAPLLSWLSAVVGHPVDFPALQTETLMGLLVPMLGLGGYRTFEKINGVASK